MTLNCRAFPTSWQLRGEREIGDKYRGRGESKEYERSEEERTTEDKRDERDEGGRQKEGLDDKK